MLYGNKEPPTKLKNAYSFTFVSLLVVSDSCGNQPTIQVLRVEIAVRVFPTVSQLYHKPLFDTPKCGLPIENTRLSLPHPPDFVLAPREEFLSIV